LRPVTTVEPIISTVGRDDTSSGTSTAHVPTAE
jgi:hypothetical protein